METMEELFNKLPANKQECFYTMVGDPGASCFDYIDYAIIKDCWKDLTVEQYLGFRQLDQLREIEYRISLLSEGI